MPQQEVTIFWIRYLLIAAGFIHLLSFYRQLVNPIIIVFLLSQNVTVIITQQQQGLLLDCLSSDVLDSLVPAVNNIRWQDMYAMYAICYSVL